MKNIFITILLLFVSINLIQGQLNKADSLSKQDSLSVTKLDTESKPADDSRKIMNDTIHVRIENIPEKDSFFLEMLKILIPTLFGGLVLWWFQKSYQDKKDKQKRFETTFFVLLDKQSEIANKIEAKIMIGLHIVSYLGIDLFIHLKRLIIELDKFQYSFSQADIDTVPSALSYSGLSEDDIIAFYHSSPARAFYERVQIDNDKELIKNMTAHVYSAVYRNYKPELSQYFNHLYDLIKFVSDEENEIKKYAIEPDYYIRMIKNRLTAPELFVLFYHGVRFPKIGELIDKYGLLENYFPEDIVHEVQKGFFKFKKTEG